MQYISAVSHFVILGVTSFDAAEEALWLTEISRPFVTAFSGNR
jgi:hypothetical protein